MSEKKEEKVNITLDGAGMSFKSEISPLIAANILKLCISAEHSPSSTIPSPEFTVDSEKTSLGEYVHKYEPTTYPEKIVAIAGYLKEHKGKESFSPEDIRPLFRTIGDVPPANFGRDFRNALTNLWIASEDNDPNFFYLTAMGLKALKGNFSGETKKTRKRNRKKSRNNGKKAMEN